VLGANALTGARYASPIAVLLRGPSGCGKSDLALRLIVDHGAVLLADDRVDVKAAGQVVMAGPPANLAGLLEVRGIGLLRLPVHDIAPVALLVDLVTRDKVERLPETASVMLCNIAVPCVRLHAFDASSAHKIMAALAVVEQPQMVVS
jgi:serine kinase of HPr protein (carbohydrate metabolism regulator)